MYYVYLLRSAECGRCYVGWTRDLKRRLSEHHRGKNATTKRWAKVRLIFYEAFHSETDSRRRERYLKTSKGRSAIRQMLRATLLLA
jgi:putative endonuclease